MVESATGRKGLCGTLLSETIPVQTCLRMYRTFIGLQSVVNELKHA
jgi:hypothetical protein